MPREERSKRAPPAQPPPVVQEQKNDRSKELEELAREVATTPKISFDCSNRFVPEVARPTHKILKMNEVYKGVYPDQKVLIEHFKAEGRLDRDVALRILDQAIESFRKQPNVLPIDAPLTICGDIHGQFFDLLKLFEVTGYPPNTRLLFLGDFVDRGYFGIEVILTLFTLKINHPEHLFMLRGNHECRHLASFFTFQEECLVKYNEEIFEKCMRAFDSLPLAAIAAKQFLCVHGGLSPYVTSVADIEAIDRFSEPPTSGPFCDLLWADPTENYGDEPPEADLFKQNGVRGCSYNFSYKAVCAFLRQNKLLCMIRAHEVQQSGYRMYKGQVSNPKFPSLITVFSAPNYLDLYGNKAAVILYDGKTFNIRQFSNVPHPFWLPNFMDVFSWSLPFVAEKILQMLTAVVTLAATAAVEQTDENALTEQEAAMVKEKSAAMKKMVEMFHVLAQQSNTMVRLKGLAPSEAEVDFTDLGNNITSSNSLSNLLPGEEGKVGDEEALFSNLKNADSRNERLPPSFSQAKMNDSLTRLSNSERKKKENSGSLRKESTGSTRKENSGSVKKSV